VPRRPWRQVVRNYSQHQGVLWDKKVASSCPASVGRVKMSCMIICISKLLKFNCSSGPETSTQCPLQQMLVVLVYMFVYFDQMTDKSATDCVSSCECRRSVMNIHLNENSKLDRYKCIFE